MCANDATLPFFFACACYFQFRPGRPKVLCANRARRRSVCYFRSIFPPMIAGLICRPLLFSSRRFSWSASVGADSSRYSVTTSNDACCFWVATCRHIYQQLLPIFSYIAACASGPSPASKLSSRPLLFFPALRPPSAQRCVDKFFARSVSLPMLKKENKKKMNKRNALRVHPLR